MTCTGRPPALVFVTRHGARLDAADPHWHLTSPTPYDPPLTYGGWRQSHALGARILALVEANDPSHSATSPPGRKCKRRRTRIAIHSSPFLRCVQTAIGIAAGMEQSKGRPESSGNHRVRSLDYQSSPRLQAILEPTRSVYDRNDDSVPTLLRVDAFLGEWLSPDYFENITHPPASKLMVAGAKASLLRTADPLEGTPQGSPKLPLAGIESLRVSPSRALGTRSNAANSTLKTDGPDTAQHSHSTPEIGNPNSAQHSHSTLKTDGPDTVQHSHSTLDLDNPNSAQHSHSTLETDSSNTAQHSHSTLETDGPNTAQHSHSSPEIGDPNSARHSHSTLETDSSNTAQHSHSTLETDGSNTVQHSDSTLDLDNPNSAQPSKTHLAKHSMNLSKHAKATEQPSPATARDSPSPLNRANTHSTRYVAPVPTYALSPSQPIPAGFVAYARDACVRADYAWDSVRPPHEWGNGGEYGEEWGAMHRRFRNGLSHMINWYRDHPPSPEGEEEDGDIETVLVLVTHGAGCNALIGALTNQPVLIDVGMASLTMATRKDVGYTRIPTTEQREQKRQSQDGRQIAQEYDIAFAASTEHLRPLSRSLTPRDKSPYRYERHGASPSSGRPSQSSPRRIPLTLTTSTSGDFSEVLSPPTKTLAGGLWTPNRQPALARVEEVPSPLKLSNDEPRPGSSSDPIAVESSVALSRQGLWGAEPRALGTQRDRTTPKRRWTLTPAT